jgi:hypothetical protein
LADENRARTEFSDRPTVSEIEITPAMIAAGWSVLMDSDYGHDPTIRSEAVVRAILSAALSAREV